ncbi:MAG: Rieske 2Fe-2S domain-containing protein [Proteobacteria bacterium]|nr:Rieske 2Fe-2S domain-containing protein [Pseudomonadota bacterium]
MTTLRDLLRLLVKGRPDGLRHRWVWRWLRTAEPTNEVDRAPVTATSEAGLGELLCRLDDLADGEVIEVMVDGRPLAVCRVGDDVFAVDGTCPHAGGALADGQLEGSVLTCQSHGWSFDVVTGDCEMDDEMCVERIPTVLSNGEVRLMEQ